MVGKLSVIIRDNNFKSLFGNVFFAGLGFLSIFILARTYSKHDFGLWVLYLTGFSLLEMVRSGLTNNALIRFLAASKTDSEKQSFIGACWVSNGTVTITIVAIIYLCTFLFYSKIEHSGFIFFFLYYPLTAIAILPFNNANSILHSSQEFGNMNMLRLWNSLPFTIFLFANWFFLFLPVYYVVWAHIASNALSSVFAMFKGWTGIQYVKKCNKERISQLLGFGKFSLGTLLGSNLLKSSDTILIGIFMNPAAVAFYSIPLKLMEMIEIPIKSLVAVALPKMSKASGEGDVAKVRDIFYEYTGILTWLLIPATLVMVFLAKPLVILFGGREYADSAPLFLIFLCYTIFIPVDRFSGIALDSINKPRLNFYKVMIMAFVNIVGDIVVLALWGNLEWVAVVTILNILAGVYFGYLLLHREINLSMAPILKLSWQKVFERLKTFK